MNESETPNETSGNAPAAGEAAVTAPAPAAKPSVALPERRRLRRALFIAGPALALLAGATLWLLGGRYIDTDDAYVKANKVNVSAEVTGLVAEVLVKENQPVRRGEPLLQLDRAPFQVAVQQAEANLAQTRLQIQSLRASYGQKLSALASAQSDLAYQQTHARRIRELRGSGAVSQSEVDDASHTLDVAGNRVQELQHDLNEALAQLNGDLKAPVETHPTYLAAAASLEKARLDLQRSTLKAPINGIASKVPDPGTYAMPGLPVMSVVAEEESWVEANFKESELEHLRVGAPVRVAIDAYPNTQWQGRLESIGQATGSEFSVLPAQNASGNWVKVVQRIPVRVRLEHRADEPPLRAGMSAEISVDTGARKHSGIARLMSAIGLGSAEAAQ